MKLFQPARHQEQQRTDRNGIWETTEHMGRNGEPWGETGILENDILSSGVAYRFPSLSTAHISSKKQFCVFYFYFFFFAIRM